MQKLAVSYSLTCTALL